MCKFGLDLLSSRVDPTVLIITGLRSQPVVSWATFFSDKYFNYVDSLLWSIYFQVADKSHGLKGYG